jgi:hypothetical protein
MFTLLNNYGVNLTAEEIAMAYKPVILIVLTKDSEHRYSPTR